MDALLPVATWMLGGAVGVLLLRPRRPVLSVAVVAIALGCVGFVWSGPSRTDGDGAASAAGEAPWVPPPALLDLLRELQLEGAPHGISFTVEDLRDEFEAGADLLRVPEPDLEAAGEVASSAGLPARDMHEISDDERRQGLRVKCRKDDGDWGYDMHQPGKRDGLRACWQIRHVPPRERWVRMQWDEKLPGWAVFTHDELRRHREAELRRLAPEARRRLRDRDLDPRESAEFRREELERRLDEIAKNLSELDAQSRRVATLEQERARGELRALILGAYRRAVQEIGLATELGGARYAAR